MNRIVIITGAGGGLGRELARGAVARGDVAIAIGRDPAALAETGAGLDPARFDAQRADVADFARLEQVIAEAADRHGRIDALFANAAVYPRLALLDQPATEFMAALAVNVGGVAAAVRGVLPAMMKRAHGRIVTCGSYADRGPIVASSAYSASKGALHALTKAIAVEVGSDYPDILVNEWIPGSLRTGMGIPDGIDPAVAAGWGLDLVDLPPGGPTSEIFFQNRMEQPPLSLKRRVLRKLRLG